MKNIFNILIADDQPIVRSGLKIMLEDQFIETTIIHEASNGLEVIDILSKNNINVLLMDLEMPKLDGISTLKKIRQRNKQLPIIILSVHDKKTIINQVVDEGANGYLSKSVGIEELVKAINTVIEGKNYYSNEITQIILGSEKETKNPLGLDIQLTRREKQILKLLAEDLSNQEIADQLCISHRTVEGHRVNLKSKLKAKSSVGLLKKAYQYGLLDE